MGGRLRIPHRNRHKTELPSHKDQLPCHLAIPSLTIFPLYSRALQPLQGSRCAFILTSLGHSAASSTSFLQGIQVCLSLPRGNPVLHQSPAQKHQPTNCSLDIPETASSPNLDSTRRRLVTVDLLLFPQALVRKVRSFPAAAQGRSASLKSLLNSRKVQFEPRGYV